MSETSDFPPSVAARYRSGENDVAGEFYVPCLQVADSYDRASGYFTSNAFPILAQGLDWFIQRSGRMRIVCSPFISEADADAIKRGYRSRDDVIEESLIQAIDEGSRQFQRPTELLAWMIGEGILEIRIAVLEDDSGIYHEKFGVFGREGTDFIGFIGSPNETRGGVLSNFEHIAVFSIAEGHREVSRIEGLRSDFDRLWQNRTPSLAVMDFPTAARNALIQHRPLSRPRPAAGKRDLSVDLYPHQVAAIDAWGEAGFVGILEMATGTGKTVTALAATRPMARQGNLIIVLVPGVELLNQWKAVIEERVSDAAVATAGGEGGWLQRMAPFLMRWKMQLDRPRSRGDFSSHYLIATMDTASSPRFLTLLERVGSNSVLIADEVHRLGAPVRRAAMSLHSRWRLGLSATPERPWDQEGQTAIEEGVGPVCFRYSLKDAIRDGFLTPYLYKPKRVSLTPEEREEYGSLSDRIQRIFAALAGKYPQAGGNIIRLSELASTEEFSQLQLLLFARADVLKEASGKMQMLAELLQDRAIKSCLVYCNDEEQVESARRTLVHHGRSYGVFTTSRLGGKERKTVLRDFEDGRFDFLIAIRCLDEGVDIPGAIHAIILASSRTEREFIQRRGRVLRTAPGKRQSVIHDPVVIPVELDPEGLPMSGVTDAEQSIVLNELRRAELFADSSANSFEALAFLHEVRGLVAAAS